MCFVTKHPSLSCPVHLQGTGGGTVQRWLRRLKGPTEGHRATGKRSTVRCSEPLRTLEGLQTPDKVTQIIVFFKVLDHSISMQVSAISHWYWGDGNRELQNFFKFYFNGWKWFAVFMMEYERPKSLDMGRVGIKLKYPREICLKLQSSVASRPLLNKSPSPSSGGLIHPWRPSVKVRTPRNASRPQHLTRWWTPSNWAGFSQLQMVWHITYHKGGLYRVKVKYVDCVWPMVLIL